MGGRGKKKRGAMCGRDDRGWKGGEGSKKEVWARMMRVCVRTGEGKWMGEGEG